MTKSNALSLQIFILSLAFGVVFFVITLYWYNNYVSIREFLESFINSKNVVVLVFIFIFAALIWLFSRIFFKKIFFLSNENNKKLSQYNHFVAHELKTPISVVYSNLEVLEYKHDTNIIKKSKKELQEIIHIIDWLLNFSESLQSSEKRDINIENLINKYTLGDNNITIHNSDFNVSVYGDEMLLWRVISNLMSNACKYSVNWNVDIYIFHEWIRIENPIKKTLWIQEIESLKNNSFWKSFEEKRWHQIGLSLLEKIVGELWFAIEITSENKRFIVSLEFNKY